MRTQLIIFTIICMLPAAGAAHASKPQAAPPATPLAVEEAMASLHSGDWILQADAMELLAAWRRTDAAPELRALAGGTAPPWVRGRALVAVAQITGEQALEDALRLAKHDSAEIRAAAVDALAIIGSPRGEPPVAAGLKDPSDQVRVAALKAAAAMRIASAASIAAAMAADEAQSLDVRTEAVVADARLRGPDALEVTFQRVGHPERRIQLAAMRALACVDAPDARTKLLELLSHPEGAMRAEAARSIGEGRVAEAIPVLLKGAAADSDGTVRAACEQSLLAFDLPAVQKPLLEALEKNDGAAVGVALRVLAEKQTPEVREAVAGIVNKSVSTFAAGFNYQDLPALCKLGPDAFANFFAACIAAQNVNDHLRIGATDCLGLCVKSDLFTLLRNAAVDENWNIQSRAINYLLQKTSSPPTGGIVAWMKGTLHDIRPAPNRSQQWHVQLVCLAIIRKYITKAEVPAAVDLLEPMLVCADGELRKQAAESLADAADAGQSARIAALQGYVTRWMVCGTFPNDYKNAGLAAVYPPEKAVDFAADYGEQPFLGFDAELKSAVTSFDGKDNACIMMYPGSRGEYPARLIAAFNVALPAEAGLRLKAAVALHDQEKGGGSQGFTFAVWAAGERLQAIYVNARDRWFDVDADLAASAGKQCRIELEVDPMQHNFNDYAYVKDARIVAGEKVIADLRKPLPNAEARSIPPGSRERKAAWRPADAPDGRLSFFEILPAPIGYSVAYAVADLRSPDDRKALIAVESDDDYAVFLNGTRLERPNDKDGKPQNQLETVLKKGGNRIMLKTCNRWDGQWWLRLRISDPSGRTMQDVTSEPAR